MSEIKKFYAGKNVLITGATGFIGKVLLEKILRECEDINSVYLIIRRGKQNFDQRCKNFLNHLVFDNVRANQPQQLKKVKIFNGDLTQDELALSQYELNDIYDNVDIILHCAASVRFDETIRDALNSNTIGVYRTLEMAKRIKQLLVFVFVSTSYSQPYLEVTEEHHYKSQIDTFALVKAYERFDENTMTALQAKILGDFPNTYSLSKHLSEDLVYQYRNDFPICVIRPSVVIAAIEDPIPNYCEGLNGFNGFAVAVGRGVLRTFYLDTHGYGLYVPVDKVTNAIITTSWLHGTKKIGQIEYYNASVNQEDTTTFKAYCELFEELRYKMPLNYSIWSPNGSVTRCYYYHYVRVILYQVIPAILIDILLRLFRQKPIMMKVQRKIFGISQTLVPYCQTGFRFNTNRFETIPDQQNNVDKAIFDADMRKLDRFAIVFGSSKGIRKFICKEKDEDIPRSITISRILHWMNIGANTVIIYYVLKFLCRRYLSNFSL